MLRPDGCSWPSAGPGDVSVPVDLGAADCRPVRRLPELAAHRCVRAALACPGRRPAGVFTLVACFRPVLPHWGLIGLVSLFPLLGRNWSERLEDRPQARPGVSSPAAAGLLAAVPGVHDRRISLWDAPARTRRPRRPDRRLARPDARPLRLGPGRRRDHKLGLVDEPGTFLFTRFWYQSAQLAHALGGKRPVLCYNADDPRGFAFWSKPDDWVGHDGILVVVGEHEAMARYYRRWFSRVEPVSDFWVEREGKPVRRIGIYRCTRQRVAYPFTRESETRLARNATN